MIIHMTSDGKFISTTPTTAPTVSAIGTGLPDAMTTPASPAAARKPTIIARYENVSGRIDAGRLNARSIGSVRADQYSLNVAPRIVMPEFWKMAASWLISLARVLSLRPTIRQALARCAMTWASDASCADGVSSRITS